MKTMIKIIGVLLIISFTSCGDKITRTFTANAPIYMSLEDLRESIIFLDEARDLVNPGKIYFKDGYIFINEEMEGIHIVDNSNPAQPHKIGFIEIPGNIDMAIKGNYLYADSYIDLIVFDVSDLSNIVEIKREKDILPYTLPPFNEDYPLAEIDEDKGVVVDWEVKEVKEEVKNLNYYPIYRYGLAMDDAMFNSFGSKGGQGGIAGGSTFGVGGSMARFNLYDDYLYLLTRFDLKILDISKPDLPEFLNSTSLGWDLETVFIHDHHMFIGTTTGMLVYSLKIPTAPEFVDNFWHIRSCDPVVIQNHIAYVTLRGGTTCGGNDNRLDVIQMTNEYRINEVLGRYAMTEPYGLGIDDELLFICDGDDGLKIYNASDPMKINQNRVANFPDINAFDVIPMENTLFMIGDDGFYQYDYSDIQNIRLLSFISVEKDD